MPPLKTIFMGTADLSGTTLSALLTEPQIGVVAVVTQPDKPKGRNLEAQPSLVKVLGQQANVPVLQPPRARDPEFLAALRPYEPDLIVVAAYGQILPAAILELPKHGCLNVHTSLLPKYRGAAPIQWAIANGDTETGVTIMKMDMGMDTGPILAQRVTGITPEDDGASLHDRLALLGAELLIATIPGYVAGEILPKPQPLIGATHAAKIKKEDGQVDWSQPAGIIWNRFRAFTPWPGAFTSWTAGTKVHRLKIWSAQVVAGNGQPGEILHAGPDGIVVACGADALCISQLQREGGRRLAPREFLAGHPLLPGEKLW